MILGHVTKVWPRDNYKPFAAFPLAKKKEGYYYANKQSLFTIFLEEEEDEQPGGCCGCCGGGANKPKKMKLPGVVDEEDSISAQFSFHKVYSIRYTVKVDIKSVHVASIFLLLEYFVDIWISFTSNLFVFFHIIYSI